MMTVVAIDTAEVLVSDDEIARRICGFICQRIKCSEVTCIRESFVKTQKRTVTSVRIIPGKVSRWRFRLRGLMMISDRFDELISILNQRISEHQIAVEFNVNGKPEVPLIEMASPKLPFNGGR